MNILGINAFHGDAAAALVRDGELVAAVAEERFRRLKHCAGFPRESIRACLELGGLGPRDVDAFAIARDPSAHAWRKAWFALRARPALALARDRWRNAARVRDVAGTLADTLGVERSWVEARLHRVEHHPAHLASAFFVSPWDQAAVCAIDGFGDFVSTSLGLGRGARLDVLHRTYFPHSLGLFYLAVTQHLGFRRYGDEYKVMGLAAYGAPEYAAALRRLLRLEPDGAFALDLAYFRHWAEGVRMTWDDGEPTIEDVFTPRIEALLGPARRPDEPIGERHQALAASLQAVFEEAVGHVLRTLHARTRQRRLCLAGGCALNSVMNGKVRALSPFEDVFVQPAASDDGTALGAAFSVWHQRFGRQRRFVMEHAAWGPGFDDAAIARALAARAPELGAAGCRVERLDDEAKLCARAAERIAAGAIVGWFHGRMEWGARALGHRSILADPRRPDMREILNARIKLREPFRPFAPAVLEEALDDYFVGAAPDPFMLHVYPVRPDRRAAIPAVTHVDGSGRLQTVSQAVNPRFWRLLRAFEAVSGVPVLLNTSFNENEPIVLRPEEALDCFLRTRMDALVLGEYVLESSRRQP